MKRRVSAVAKPAEKSAADDDDDTETSYRRTMLMADQEELVSFNRSRPVYV